MRKRVYAITLGIILLFMFSICAAAGSSIKTGQTSGGFSGILNTSATLNCGAAAASATTSVSGHASGYTVATTVNFTFYNANYHLQTTSGTGTTSAYAYSTTGSGGYSASSSHTVNGGSEWGVWGVGLSTNY